MLTCLYIILERQQYVEFSEANKKFTGNNKNV